MPGYKKDQGRMARMAVFWSLTVLFFYGCTSLNGSLSGYFPALAGPLVESFPQVPVLGTRLTGAFVVSAVIFLAGMIVLYRWLERPKSADLLIETELELRKVTWPTGSEVVNSSVVVIVCVVFLMGYLAVADWFLARVTRVIMFGGS
jgi:preprotein translocase SecE subunit